MGKVILVVADALRDDAAAEYMGHLEHLVEVRQATRYSMRAELPTLSRPAYETIHTGLPPSAHGITSNAHARLSSSLNVFSLARDQGRTTAAAAYFWYSELYNRTPYDPIADREVDDPALAIQHGRFYTEDAFPDKDLYASGASLVLRYQPDYLLIHPMGLDYLGEMHGGESKDYRRQVVLHDMILAYGLDPWRAAGYTLLITGDHGIDAQGIHGGSTLAARMVPLYAVPASGKGRGAIKGIASQLSIAPTILRLLGLSVPPSMQAPVLRV